MDLDYDDNDYDVLADDQSEHDDIQNDISTEMV